jgi:1-acyl-sn-glycerol-3-phosphate acyltransferase
MIKASITKFFKLFLLFFGSIGRYALNGAVILLFFPPALLLVCMPKEYRYRSRFLFWILDKLYKGIRLSLMVPITILGTEHMPQGPAIFVANHESVLDIPLLGSLLNGQPHIWYIYAYYAHVPVLGFFARRMGVIVDMAQPLQAARSLKEGIERAQDYQCHTLIFPEGGRYNDGTVHPFFPGFSLIAKSTSYPVVPVFMQHPGAIYPPGSFLAYPCPLRIIIGKPFVYTKEDTTKSFTARVYRWFVECSGC